MEFAPAVCLSLLEHKIQNHRAIAQIESTIEPNRAVCSVPLASTSFHFFKKYSASIIQEIRASQLTESGDLGISPKM